MAKASIPKKPLIESDNFPLEFLSQIAERESWRKDINRPIYHLHKWWAKRLGTVFRGAILGSLLNEKADLAEHFYSPGYDEGVVIFDPFMGSGTTVGEAYKLGCTALGRDINPVACESVRVSLGPMNPASLWPAFDELERTVGRKIQDLYKTKLPSGAPAEVLYFFWVKVLPCPECGKDVELRNEPIFARNAYPDRKPEVSVCCPCCGDVFRAIPGKSDMECPTCHKTFDPHQGPVNGSKATCNHCATEFGILKEVRKLEAPPRHKLYAKMVLRQDGKKEYVRATDADEIEFSWVVKLLKKEIANGNVRLPMGQLEEGYNTRQAMSWNYREWKDFFNPRQLLALGWLHEAILKIPEPEVRDVFLSLFSGCLEFNNVFTSFKGEGTGAVRHMFAHHILKPERLPLEANLWGTSRSSGSFSGLVRTRLSRLLDYRDHPFELSVSKGKVPLAKKLEFGPLAPWPTVKPPQPGRIHLSCGSSQNTGLPTGSVDLVVTDPPFFDNVHYSELADFFYAWQRLKPRGLAGEAQTSRAEAEVQDTVANEFSRKLRAVLVECHRVLRDQGLLVFSYHHSKPEGWSSLCEAVLGAGFVVTAAQPLKAEMSVATPKSAAKEPIQLDVLLICRKRKGKPMDLGNLEMLKTQADGRARQKADRLVQAGFGLSVGDLRVIYMSELLAQLGNGDPAQVAEALEEANRNFIMLSIPKSFLHREKVSQVQLAL